MTWDRFDICEAYACLAHDFGLYGIAARLDGMQFRARPSLHTSTMTDNAREIYDGAADRALGTGARDQRLARPTAEAS